MPFTQRRFSRRRNRQLNKVRSQRKKNQRGSRKQRRVRHKVRGGANLWNTEQNASIQVTERNSLTCNSTANKYIPCLLENPKITSTNSTITFKVTGFWSAYTGIQIGVSTTNGTTDKYWCVNLVSGYRSYLLNNEEQLSLTDGNWIEGKYGYSDAEREFTIDKTQGIMKVTYNPIYGDNQTYQWKLPSFEQDKSLFWRIQMKTVSATNDGYLKIIA